MLGTSIRASSLGGVTTAVSESTSSDEGIFSLEICVGRLVPLRKEAKGLLPYLAFRFLDFPELSLSAVSDSAAAELRTAARERGMSDMALRADLTRLCDSNGTYVLNKGKSCLFRARLEELRARLEAIPLYILLTDGMHEGSGIDERRLIASGGVRLDASARLLVQGAARSSAKGMAVVESLGTHLLVDLMGHAIARVELSCRLFSLGTAALPHLRDKSNQSAKGAAAAVTTIDGGGKGNTSLRNSLAASLRSSLNTSQQHHRATAAGSSYMAGSGMGMMTGTGTMKSLANARATASREGASLAAFLSQPDDVLNASLTATTATPPTVPMPFATTEANVSLEPAPARVSVAVATNLAPFADTFCPPPLFFEQGLEADVEEPQYGVFGLSSSLRQSARPAAVRRQIAAEARGFTEALAATAAAGRAGTVTELYRPSTTSAAADAVISGNPGVLSNFPLLQALQAELQELDRHPGIGEPAPLHTLEALKSSAVTLGGAVGTAPLAAASHLRRPVVVVDPDPTVTTEAGIGRGGQRKNHDARALSVETTPADTQGSWYSVPAHLSHTSELRETALGLSRPRSAPAYATQSSSNAHPNASPFTQASASRSTRSATTPPHYKVRLTRTQLLRQKMSSTPSHANSSASPEHTNSDGVPSSSSGTASDPRFNTFGAPLFGRPEYNRRMSYSDRKENDIIDSGSGNALGQSSSRSPSKATAEEGAKEGAKEASRGVPRRSKAGAGASSGLKAARVVAESVASLAARGAASRYGVIGVSESGTSDSMLVDLALDSNIGAKADVTTTPAKSVTTPLSPDSLATTSIETPTEMASTKTADLNVTARLPSPGFVSPEEAILPLGVKVAADALLIEESIVSDAEEFGAAPEEVLSEEGIPEDVSTTPSSARSEAASQDSIVSPSSPQKIAAVSSTAVDASGAHAWVAPRATPTATIHPLDLLEESQGGPVESVDAGRAAMWEDAYATENFEEEGGSGGEVGPDTSELDTAAADTLRANAWASTLEQGSGAQQQKTAPAAALAPATKPKPRARTQGFGGSSHKVLDGAALVMDTYEEQEQQLVNALQSEQQRQADNLHAKLAGRRYLRKASAKAASEQEAAVPAQAKNDAAAATPGAAPNPGLSILERIKATRASLNVQ